MGDLLIRNLDPDVKKRLSASAHSNGRSLSAEAESRLKLSLAHDQPPRQPAGQRLRALVNGFVLTDDERAQIAAIRHEGDRDPPVFGG